MSFTEGDYTDFLVRHLEGEHGDAWVDWLEQHVTSERDMFQFMFTTTLMASKMIRLAASAPDTARFGVVNAGKHHDRDAGHAMSMIGAGLNDDHDTLSALISAALSWPEEHLAKINATVLTAVYRAGQTLQQQHREGTDA